MTESDSHDEVNIGQTRPNTNTRTESNRTIIGMLLFTGIGILASSRHGFLGNFPHPYNLGICISLLAGAVAGLLMFPQYRLSALTCCPAAAAFGYAALDWYLPGRESVNTVEIVLVQIIAALPAILVANLIRIFVHPSTNNQSPEK